MTLIYIRDSRLADTKNASAILCTIRIVAAKVRRQFIHVERDRQNTRSVTSERSRRQVFALDRTANDRGFGATDWISQREPPTSCIGKSQQTNMKGYD